MLKYSRNGCLVDDNVLIMSEAYEKLNEVEFRSLAIGKHKDHDALFIADAAGDESRLLIFGGCIKEQDDYFMRNKRYVTFPYSMISILSSFAMIQIDDDTTDISFKSWLLGQIIQGWITGERETSLGACSGVLDFVGNPLDLLTQHQNPRDFLPSSAPKQALDVVLHTYPLTSPFSS